MNQRLFDPSKSQEKQEVTDDEEGFAQVWILDFFHTRDRERNLINGEHSITSDDRT